MFLGTMDRTVPIVRYSADDAEPTILHQLGIIRSTEGQATQGHTGSIRSIAYDGKRKYLFTGSFDTTVIIWDIGAPGRERYGRVAGVLRGHTGKVKGVAWCAETKTLFSTGDDKTVRMWDVGQGGRCVRTFQAHEGWVLGCVFLKELGLLLTWSKDKTIKGWRVAPGTESDLPDPTGSAHVDDTPDLPGSGGPL